jgi:hypothetical protein
MRPPILQSQIISPYKISADGARVRALLGNYLDQRILFYKTRDEQQLRKINAATGLCARSLFPETGDTIITEDVRKFPSRELTGSGLGHCAWSAGRSSVDPRRRKTALVSGAGSWGPVAA